MAKVFIYKKGDLYPRFFNSLNEAQAYIGEQVEKALVKCPKDKRVKVDINSTSKNKQFGNTLSLEYSTTLENK